MLRAYRLPLLLAAILILGLTSCGNQVGEVKGYVRHAGKGDPIPGAQVTAFTLVRFEEVTNMNAFQKGEAVGTTVANEEGIFTFSLEPESYVLEAQAEGYQTTTHMVETKGGRVLEVFINMNPAP
jgi:hypothetical protein